MTKEKLINKAKLWLALHGVSRFPRLNCIDCCRHSETPDCRNKNSPITAEEICEIFGPSINCLMWLDDEKNAKKNNE